MAGETGGTTDRLLNKLQYAAANKAADVGTATTSDLMFFVDVSDDYEVKTGDGANVLEAAGVTATAAEINAAADVSSRVVTIPDADTAILAANSGKTHVIANVSADRTFTLPAVATAGLEFLFVATVGAADGHDWIFATADTDELFAGGVFALDSDASPTVGDVIVADQSDDDAFQVNVPEGGTWVRMVSDGTSWHVSGTVLAAAFPAFS